MVGSRAVRTERSSTSTSTLAKVPRAKQTLSHTALSNNTVTVMSSCSYSSWDHPADEHYKKLVKDWWLEKIRKGSGCTSIESHPKIDAVVYVASAVRCSPKTRLSRNIHRTLFGAVRCNVTVLKYRCKLGSISIPVVQEIKANRRDPSKIIKQHQVGACQRLWVVVAVVIATRLPSDSRGTL
eukprot:1216024-Amphidinium_carterae.1